MSWWAVGPCISCLTAHASIPLYHKPAGAAQSAICSEPTTFNLASQHKHGERTSSNACPILLSGSSCCITTCCQASKFALVAKGAMLQQAIHCCQFDIALYVLLPHACCAEPLQVHHTTASSTLVLYAGTCLRQAVQNVFISLQDGAIVVCSKACHPAPPTL